MVMKSLCIRNSSGGTESPIRLSRWNGQGGAFQRARQILPVQRRPSSPSSSSRSGFFPSLFDWFPLIITFRIVHVGDAFAVDHELCSTALPASASSGMFRSVQAQKGGRKSCLISSRRAWDRVVRGRESSTALRGWEFPGGRRACQCVRLRCSRSGPASNDSCCFLLMKCGFLAVASVVVMQGGEITMSVEPYLDETEARFRKPG
jgi:hypothetical protein